MLAVILRVLAIIGILLLILLGIVLFLLLVIFFFPITYNASGVFNDEERSVSVKANWLCGIVRFRLNFSKELTYQLKIFWKDVLKPKAASAKETKKTAESVAEKPADSTDIKNTTPKQVVTKIKPTQAESEAGESKASSGKEESSETADFSAKESISDKINKLIFKIKSICDKIKEIWENITYYLELLQEDDTKLVISHCVQMILKILKSIRPRKLKLDAVFGFNSPDTTGYVYGFVCMLYPYYGNNIHITPDFERQILQGSFSCKGHIIIFVLLINGLRILFDKKFQILLKKLKHGGKQNGR